MAYKPTRITAFRAGLSLFFAAMIVAGLGTFKETHADHVEFVPDAATEQRYATARAVLEQKLGYLPDAPDGEWVLYVATRRPDIAHAMDMEAVDIEGSTWIFRAKESYDQLAVCQLVLEFAVDVIQGVGTCADANAK